MHVCVEDVNLFVINFTFDLEINFISCKHIKHDARYLPQNMPRSL